MFHATAIAPFAPFGQASPDLATTIATAEQASRLLAAFAQKLRTVGAPIQRELVEIGRQISAKFPDPEDAPEDDPLIVRGDQLSFASSIHVPQREGQPFGQFPIEITIGDLEALTNARAAIAAAISSVRNEPIGSVNKRLVDRNAFPTFAGKPIIDEAIRIENLVDLFETDVTGRPRLKGINVGVVLGGIAVGLLGLGVLSYATRPGGKGKRR